MIDPKKELRDYLERLVNRFLNITSLNDELKRIHDWGTTPEKTKTRNRGAYFFALAKYSISRTILVELTNFLSKGATRSLHDWLEKAKEQAKSLNPTRYNPSKGVHESISTKEYRSIVDNHIKQLESKEYITKRIKAHRDKSIAHLDKEYFDEIRDADKDFPLNHSDIDDILQTISGILRKQYLCLFETDMRMEVSSLRNLDKVLRHVRAFMRMWEESPELCRKGVRPADYLAEEYPKKSNQI